MPEISIIIPVYNTEPYLPCCIVSVFAQTFQDFELFLVDDGSTDGSGALCDEYAGSDPRVHVIHKENGGQGPARNMALDAAAGKYVIFLDSDDYWDPETLEVLFSEAEKNQLQLLLFGAEPFFDGIDDFPTLDYTHTIQNGEVKSGPESMTIAFANNEYYTAPCLRFYLRNYLQEKGFRFDEGIIHEDESFGFLSYMNADRVECIGNRFYKRRYRPNSTMTSKSLPKSAHGYCVAMDRILDAFLEDPDRKNASLFSKQVQLYMRTICRSYENARKEAKSDPKNHGTAREIARDARPVFRKARVFRSDLPPKLRWATHGLQFGCWQPKFTEMKRRVRDLPRRVLKKIKRILNRKK